MTFRLICIAMLFASSGLCQTSAPKRIIEPSLVAPKLVRKGKPVYPKNVRDVRNWGPVVVNLVVDKDGKGKDFKVVKGDPVLVDAALKSLHRWRWKPYKLEGVPVEVETTVTVIFDPR